ncbi:hypothetical protein F5884DRAFT_852495 [Xylogone sp. PMI_703]|nr:hypothetical protein F5884DRAFT_852495 [Xylogone sp. PMI_703]
MTAMDIGQTIRKAHHDALEELACEIEECENQVLDETDLVNYTIQAEKIELDKHGNPSKDLPYFAPYHEVTVPTTELDTFIKRGFPEYGLYVTESLVGKLYDYFGEYLSWCEHSVRQSRHPLWTTKGVYDYDYKKLFGIEHCPECEIIHVSDIPGSQYPHLRCMMLNNIPHNNDQLLRSEMLALTTYMYKRLESNEFAEHVVAPVILISFMGSRQARILQAHFDGESVMIHYTKLYDLKNDDLGTLNLFVRWGLCHPTGLTTCPRGITLPYRSGPAHAEPWY